MPVLKNLPYIPFCTRYVQPDWGKAENALKQALKLSSEAKSQKAILKNLTNLGALHVLTGAFDEARKWLYKAIEFADAVDEVSPKTYALDRLGVIAEREGNYKASIRLKREALELADQLGNENETWRLKINLGASYYFAKDYDKAEALWQEALSMHPHDTEKVGSGASTLLVNLGHIAFARADYQKAEKK